MSNNSELYLLKSKLKERARKDSIEELSKALLEPMLSNKEAMCLQSIKNALSDLCTAKPQDRSEIDRRYAVTITELEKVLAYFKMFCCS